MINTLCARYSPMPICEEPYVAALVDLVEVADVGVRPLKPAARGPEDLVGEGGEADRQRDLRRRLAGRKRLGSSELPVPPGRRRPGPRQPVQREVVDDRVTGEIAGGLPVEKGPRDLVVAVGVVVEQPG